VTIVLIATVATFEMNPRLAIVVGRWVVAINFLSPAQWEHRSGQAPGGNDLTRGGIYTVMTVEEVF